MRSKMMLAGCLLAMRAFPVTVSFDTQGLGADPAPMACAETYGELPEVAAAGAVFDGWWMCPGDGRMLPAKSGGSLIADADHVLTARWKGKTAEQATVDTRTHTVVSYDVQGIGETPKDSHVVLGERYGELAVPEGDAGHVFAGWWMRDGEEFQVTPDQTVTIGTNHVLTAKWKGRTTGYALIATGASEVRLRNPLDDGWDGSLIVEIGYPYGALPELTAEGYWADGWWTAADRARGVHVTADTPVSIVGDHTLYALWTARPVPDPAAETTVTVREGLCVTIPNAWFAAHGLAGDDLAAVALSPSPGTDGKGKADAAGNAVSVWQDYIAGTDPNDSDDTLLAEIEMVDGKPLINWRPSMNGFDANGDSIQTGTRHYRIWGKETLSADVPWRDTDVTPGDYHFFRVTVEMRK